ncbi:hypothetical protein Lser_V15G21626 [Lactuca serriola]
MQLTEEAQSRKPKLERWLDEFGESYSKAVIVLSISIALIGPILFKWPIFSTPDKKRLLIPCLAEATGRRGQKSTVSSNKAYQFHMSDKRGWCFTCEVEGLVMREKDGNSPSPLFPLCILTHIENIGSNLGHGKEEDAHEFLRYVIDALQVVCIKEVAGPNALQAVFIKEATVEVWRQIGDA